MFVREDPPTYPLDTISHDNKELIRSKDVARISSGMLRTGARAYGSTRKWLKITEAWPMAAG